MVSLFIMAPGALINVYFLAFASKESWTTWFSVLTNGVLMYVLLILALYYKHRTRGSNKYWFMDSEDRNNAPVSNINNVDAGDGDEERKPLLNY